MCQDTTFSWKEVVERHSALSSGDPRLRVRVCSINELTDRDDTDIRVGDELFIRDVTVKHAELSLAQTDEDSNCETITIPVTMGCKFRVLPFYTEPHAFKSVRELLDIYPAVDDVIYPKESFELEGLQIVEWDMLLIIGKVQDSTSHREFLEVKIEKLGSKVLLPGDLKRTFVQMKTDPIMLLNEPIPERGYSLQELCGLWRSNLPLRIQLIYKDDDGAATVPNKKSSWFKKKNRSQSDERKSKPEENWMIPRNWRNGPMYFHPVKVVHVYKSLSENSPDIPIYADFKMDVIEIKTKQTPQDNSSSGLRLQDFDLESLLPQSQRTDAITAVVTSGAKATLDRKSPIRYGNLIALHRTRKVRKLILSSPESKNYLLSAKYGGAFIKSRMCVTISLVITSKPLKCLVISYFSDMSSRLIKEVPIVFERVGDVPCDFSNAYYTTTHTSYPQEHDLDACREGEIVKFIRKSTIPRMQSNQMIEVFHCTVSDGPGLPAHSVTYPMYLRGSFKLSGESESDLRTCDLFRQTLPCHVKVDKCDPMLGFDPLVTKKVLIVREIVTEMTAIIGSAHVDEMIASSNLQEVATCRGSLTVCHPSEQQQAKNYPKLCNWPGVTMLPCVEIITEKDVICLRNAKQNFKPSVRTTVESQMSDHLTCERKISQINTSRPEKQNFAEPKDRASSTQSDGSRTSSSKSVKSNDDTDQQSDEEIYIAMEDRVPDSANTALSKFADSFVPAMYPRLQPPSRDGSKSSRGSSFEPSDNSMESRGSSRTSSSSNVLPCVSPSSESEAFNADDFSTYLSMNSTLVRRPAPPPTNSGEQQEARPIPAPRKSMQHDRLNFELDAMRKIRSADAVDESKSKEDYPSPNYEDVEVVPLSPISPPPVLHPKPSMYKSKS